MKHNPSALTTWGRISRSCEKTQGRPTMILVLIPGFNRGNQVKEVQICFIGLQLLYIGS